LHSETFLRAADFDLRKKEKGTKMKTKILLISLFANLLLVLAACNSVTPSTSNPSAKLHAFIGAVPGFHGLTATKTTAFSFSIVPEAHAQVTQTVSFTGSYSGFCTQANPPSAALSSFTLYGAGQLDPTACANFYSDSISDAAANAAGQGGGQLVIGDGTLGPLVAYGNSTATVSVFVKRGGQVLDTGISVTLDGTRATSTATFPALDGDYVIVAADSHGLPATGLQFVLAKQ
jgi:hypothetical protein